MDEAGPVSEERSRALSTSHEAVAAVSRLAQRTLAEREVRWTIEPTGFEPNSGAARTLLVGPDGTAPFSSIEGAVAAARDGDRIRVLHGEYLTSAEIDKRVEVFADKRSWTPPGPGVAGRGGGARVGAKPPSGASAVLIYEGNRSAGSTRKSTLRITTPGVVLRGFDFVTRGSDAVIEDFDPFALEADRSRPQASIYIEADSSIEDCAIFGGSASGAGIYVDRSETRIADCFIYDCPEPVEGESWPAPQFGVHAPFNCTVDIRRVVVHGCRSGVFALAGVSLSVSDSLISGSTVSGISCGLDTRSWLAVTGTRVEGRPRMASSPPLDGSPFATTLDVIAAQLGGGRAGLGSTLSLSGISAFNADIDISAVELEDWEQGLWFSMCSGTASRAAIRHCRDGVVADGDDVTVSESLLASCTVGILAAPEGAHRFVDNLFSACEVDQVAGDHARIWAGHQ